MLRLRCIPSARLKLAVPPGRYLVRRRDRERTLAHEVVVTMGYVTAIDEANLEVMALPMPASKGDLTKKAEPPKRRPPRGSSTLPPSSLEMRLSGVGFAPELNGLNANLNYQGMTAAVLASFGDRLTLSSAK